jgi:hypothetical protein
MSWIYMRKHHKEKKDKQKYLKLADRGESQSPKDSADRGSIPKDSSDRGRSPKGKLPFSIDVKGGERE